MENTITSSSPSSSVAPALNIAGPATQTQRVAAGSLSGAQDASVQYVGVVLTPYQQMLVNFETLIGIYLKMSTSSRQAEREHGLYARKMIQELVEREAEKMGASAFHQFIGSLVQGLAGLVGGAVQIGGSINSLNKMATAYKQHELSIKLSRANEQSARARLATAEEALAGDVDHPQLQGTRAEAAKLHDEAKKGLNAALNAAAGDERVALAKVLEQVYTGVREALKSSGDLVDAGMKYGASAFDKEKMLLESFKQFVQGTQQSSQEFVQEQAEVIRQLLEYLKAWNAGQESLGKNLAQMV